MAKNIEYIGAGDFNDVVRVDDEVFRFPKKEEGRQALLYDEAILAKLAGKVTLQIPDVHQTAADGSYAVLSYVPGRVLSSEEIMALSDEQKRGMAQKIAVCMREISSTLSTEEVLRLQRQYIPWYEDNDTYYANNLQQFAGAKYSNLYARYYEIYIQLRSKVGMPKKIVIYDDYHYGNMLFNEANELVGLIDFSDVSVGSAVNDLRQLYRLGEDIVSETVRCLHGDLGDVDIELVRLNAILHEIAVLLRPESQPPNNHPRAELALHLLAQWLGEGWENAI